jgi:molecular chaperone Hsp33
LRGLAKWKGKVTGSSFRKAVGQGHLAITIDPASGSRYQGVVNLNEKNLASSIEDYFSQSEQLPTCLFLTASKVAAAGFLLQAIPGDAGKTQEKADDFWQQLVYLTRTLTAKELLTLSTKDILGRLYHEVLQEQDIQLFEREPVSFRCSCSQSRIENTLHLLPHHEVMELLAEQKALSIVCEFCNHAYSFDAVDVERIFSSGAVVHGSTEQR